MKMRISSHNEQPDTLYFSPLAWLKLQWFCHAGPTEIGGFGISAEHNPLYVEEFITVRQSATSVSVKFDNAAVADYFDAMVDRGLKPSSFGRLWMHTHPGSSPRPSGVDEGTFQRHFGHCDWSLMFIVDRVGQTYARLSFSSGPGAQLLLPVAVHWADWPESIASQPNLEARIAQWQKEYQTNIHRQNPPVTPLPIRVVPDRRREDQWWDAQPWREDLDDIYYELCEQGDPYVRPSV